MKHKSKSVTILYSSILAGVVFILFFVMFKFGLILSVGAELTAFVAGILIFKPAGKKELIELQMRGISNEELREVMKEGLPKYQKLMDYSAAMQDGKMKQQVLDIARIVKDIFDDFKKDPKDIRLARQFLNYYLDATIKILDQYKELSLHADTSKEIQESLKRVGKLLSEVKTAFQAQLTKLLDNDVMDLKTEVDLLEKTLTLEGLGEKNEK